MMKCLKIDDDTLIGTVIAISSAGNQITLSSAADITDDVGYCAGGMFGGACVWVGGRSGR